MGKRLTERMPNGKIIFSDYCMKLYDAGHENATFEKLADLEDADEEGRLFIIPREVMAEMEKKGGK